jgi:hypothetical protein
VLGRPKRSAYRVVAQKGGPPEFDRIKGKPEGFAEVHYVIPQSAWDDAGRRANVPRSLTAWLSGDPALGHSTLDQSLPPAKL